MRTAVLLAALAFGNTCAATGGTVTVTLRAISSGAYGQASSASAVAAFDEESYRTTWRSQVGEGEMPAIDFSSEAVVFLFAGSRPTGGYSIEVHGATIEGGTLIVDAAIDGPPAGAMVTQALTSPFAVVAVDSRKFKDVKWTP